MPIKIGGDFVVASKPQPQKPKVEAPKPETFLQKLAALKKKPELPKPKAPSSQPMVVRERLRLAKPKADDLINRKQNSPFLQDMKNKE